ncbi:unnamed protein product [Adineta steineri]|uniref:DNA-directed primase/polymerase protein n=1 Tax=Adineta steineri TaxID=433720 RepID=A0A819US92_9BILA|nr:unnamed protein product [Adineta steineri]
MPFFFTVHPGAIINILKEESNQLGNDGLFARFVFSARISREDIHKRSKREIDTITGEYTIESSYYPSLAHIMYFIHLMHNNKSFTLKISQEANEIIMRAHNEYNHTVVGFQGYQDELCTLFSKSRDHLYRICGLLHLLHPACTYILKAEPRLEYLVFDDASAESIERIANLAQQNIDEYLTISSDIAETTLELMNFYVNTKKLLYGFPLITVPPLVEINVGPSISQQNNTTEENIQINNSSINVNNNDIVSVFSNRTCFSDLSSSICPFNGSVVDASIKKILFYPYRIISSFRLAQILRRPAVNSENVKKIFTFMANCKMGTFSIKKQKKLVRWEYREVQWEYRGKKSKAIHFRENFYRLQKTNKNGTNRWVCTKRQCSASLTIKNNTIQAIRGAHNHGNLKRSPSIIKTVTNIREKVCTNVSQPITQIYNEAVSDYRKIHGTAESVPVFDILRSTLYRDRAVVFPKLPTAINELILPENFTKNLYNEKMLFCDKIKQSRLLAFSSLSALKQLAQSTIWNADGTFRTAPKFFSQSYTIHAHDDYSMKPIVFSALPDKFEETYSTVLEALVLYAQTNNVILNPTSILIDFEQAAFNAFKKLFPNANILFCHFHFAKNIMKRLKKLQLYNIGLNDELKKDNVKREIANILSLPLLPPNKITAAFFDTVEVLESINRNFKPFLNYVEKTYIINANIENNNKNRQFFYCTINELITLYKHCPPLERTLYEIIFPTSLIKTYIDFEYYIDNNVDIKNQSIGATSCLKILYHVLNFFDTTYVKAENDIDNCLQQFLILQASTSKKISYHFIHANTTILFENNITLGIFIKTVIHFTLSSVIEHKCSFFNVDFNLQKSTIPDLIIFLSPYIDILRVNCTKCYLPNSYIQIAEIAHLIVRNKQNQWTLAIDLNVYSKHQQFRLFDCVKRGENNFLVQSINFPFYNHSTIPYDEVLQQSLITYNINISNLHILYLDNNQFKIKPVNSNNLYPEGTIDLKILNTINKHHNSLFILKSNLISFTKSNDLRLLQGKTINYINVSEEEIQKFTSFVQKLITSDTNHQGYIQSCVRGDYNNQLLFFNIGGNYRFCPKKGSHHQHNSVAILVDTKKLTYTIRCKDSQCNNISLIWNTIE